MSKQTRKNTRENPKIRELSFLIGKWHTEGEIIDSTSASSGKIRGMDTYEWISGGHFILHRVDVFMDTQRTEVIEIIGFDDKRKAYFMTSFDNQGTSTTMYATLEKSGILKISDKEMRSTLSVAKNGNSMTAKWEQLQKNKWLPWLDMKLTK
jgi:hypothetical protein